MEQDFDNFEKLIEEGLSVNDEAKKIKSFDFNKDYLVDIHNNINPQKVTTIWSKMTYMILIKIFKYGCSIPALFCWCPSFKQQNGLQDIIWSKEAKEDYSTSKETVNIRTTNISDLKVPTLSTFGGTCLYIGAQLYVVCDRQAAV